MILNMSALRVENPMNDSRACKAGQATLMAMMALLLSACAIHHKPVNQEVALRVFTEDGERVEASCDLSNDRASWSVVAPVVVGVTRSEKPLSVECNTPEGGRATRVFDSIKYGELPGGGSTGYSYPSTLELALVPLGKAQSVHVELPAYARIDDLSKLPKLDEEGHEGYRRFLAGELPRAFAISDKGRWVRVNAARGAARVAMDRCQSYGGRCRLYAVDDEVVWDQKRNELVAAY
jgi:hypothetical protein